MITRRETVTANSEGSPAGPKPGPRRKPLRTALSLALLAAALWFLWRTGTRAGWDNLGRRLSEVSPLLLLVAIAANLLRYMVWGVRWQLLLRPVARPSWWLVQRGLMASVFYNTVVPGARPFGGLIRARYLSRSSGLPLGPLFGSALVDQSGYSLISMALGMVFLPGAFLAERAGGLGVSWFVGASLLVVGIVLLVAWRRRERLVEGLRQRLPAMAEAVSGTFRTARSLLGRPRSWMVMVAGGALVWLGNIVTFQLAAAALGSAIPFSVAAAAFSLGSLAGVASGSPGGAGTTEAAAIVPLVHLGVAGDLALAAVLLARGIHYASAVLLGGACALAGR
jgi:uncharacterized protein (TIRG00374 family)